MALWTTKDGKQLRVTREMQLLLALTKCRDSIAMHLPRDEFLEQAIKDADRTLGKDGFVYLKNGKIERLPLSHLTEGRSKDA